MRVHPGLLRLQLLWGHVGACRTERRGDSISRSWRRLLLRHPSRAVAVACRRTVMIMALLHRRAVGLLLVLLRGESLLG